MNRDIKYSATLDPSGFDKGVSGINAGLSSLKTGMANVGSAVQTHWDRVGGTFSMLQGKVVALAAIAAGGAFFKESINAANQLNGEVMSLSKRLGITAQAASTLNTALGDIYSDSETYISAFGKFAKEIKNNESKLQEMGLQTRDTNGHLRDSNTLFMEALQVVSNYKPGLDQTTAAMTLFGKGVDEVMTLQKLNNQVLEDAAQKNRDLGLALTVESVEASKQYKAAMNDVGDVLTGIKVTIGRAVMPAFTELGKYFAEAGPYVINVFKGALTGLMLAFRGVQAIVKIVTEAIFEFINTTIDNIGNMADVIRKLFSGDFEGAFESAKAIWARNGVALKRIFVDNVRDAFGSAQDSFSQDLQRIWNPTEATAKPKGGTKTMEVMETKPPVHEKSNMPQYEEELAQAKQLAAEKDALRDYTKEQELAFWQTILTREDVVSKDRIAISKKVADLRTAILREEAKKHRDLDLEVLKGQQDAALDAVEAARMEADGQYRMGLISKAQLLELEKGFEEQRFEIRRQYLQARLALIDPDRDPVAYEQTNQQIEELERQHRMRLRGIQLEAMADSPFTNVMKSAEQSFASAIEGMINRTMTLRQALTSIWAGIRGAIVKEIATIIARKVAAWAVERALTLAGIGADAAKAGSGAASSVASIPYVGPVLAIAALATVMAAVMGAQGKVPSAARGFDIPSGVNPLTQLHEEEMVLPSEIANNFRAMFAVNGGGAAGGAAGGGGAPFVLHPLPGGFYALSENEFLRFFGQMKAQRKV